MLNLNDGFGVPNPTNSPTVAERPEALRVFGHLPPCIPSRLCLAGVRKPLTMADILLHGNETTRRARFRRFNLTEHQIG
jgi:hypothetical protein